MLASNLLPLNAPEALASSYGCHVYWSTATAYPDGQLLGRDGRPNEEDRQVDAILNRHGREWDLW